MKKIIGTSKDRDGRKKYTVECIDCGYTSKVRVTKYDKDANCKICLTIARNKEGKGRGVKHGPISKTFYNMFKNRAKRRGVGFSVSLEHVNSIWTGICALSGMEITAPYKTDSNGNCIMNSYTTASLDRIDSNMGYVEGNVQWVNKHINIMKNGYSQEEFIYLCHQVASNNANQQPSVLKGNRKSVGTKVQRLEGEDYQPITPPRVPDIP